MLQMIITRTQERKLRKELDKKASKGKSKETDNKKRERKRKPEFFIFVANIIATKMKNKDIALK